MGKDWSFAVDNSMCDVRTVGVLVRDGKIILDTGEFFLIRTITML